MRCVDLIGIVDRKGVDMDEPTRPEDERSALGNAPPSVHPVDDADEFRDRCISDRASLSPRETADCAGSELAELYENEEDGGS